MIHNDSHSYVELSGTRLPNLFHVADGSSVGLMQVYFRIKELEGELAQVIQPYVQSDVSGLIDNIRQFAQYVYELKGVADKRQNGDSYISFMEPIYEAILKDPAWLEVTPAKMTVITKALEAAFASNPDLRDVRDRIRVYNRLTHRKLFLVEQEGQACVIIGGRNLGDHYLTGAKESYRDGDVFFCTQQNAAFENFMAAANKDLDQLISDRSDPVLGRGASPVEITRIPKRSYQYRYINPNTLVKALPVDTTHLTGIALPNFSEPQLLIATWNPKQDQVRAELLKAIAQEQREFYIETGYAAFDSQLKAAIEAAVKRGFMRTS